jgi:spore coat polysaccharide biosynthesis protein SpsF
MKVIAAVQARMGSSRLPNKVMALIEGKPMVWHIAMRLHHAKFLQDVVFSIPNGTSDDSLRYVAIMEGVPYYAGKENDIIDRMYQTARAFGADALVRITADSPLVDPEIVDSIVRTLVKDNLEYVCNVCPCTFPAGMAVEAYSVELLERLWKDVTDATYREWPAVYLWERLCQLQTANLAHYCDLSNLRWTVDYEDDLTFVREVYKNLYSPNKIFLMEDILELLRRCPDIAAINAGINTNPFHGLSEDTICRIRI